LARPTEDDSRTNVPTPARVPAASVPLRDESRPAPTDSRSGRCARAQRPRSTADRPRTGRRTFDSTGRTWSDLDE